MHFSEIIKLQFRKKNPIHCFIFWRILEIFLVNYLGKMRGYPNFLFGFQEALLRSVFPA